MRVLITHERSGKVREAFRALGHDAWSCDTAPAEDDSYFHIQGDAIEALGAGCPTDGKRWDFSGSHPTCTFLANSGVRWLYERGTRNPVESRWRGLRSAAIHFHGIMAASSHIPRGYIENPIMHGHAKALIFGISVGGRDTYGFDPAPQIIQPWMFSHMETKATCLWTKNLPALVETINVREAMNRLPKSQTHKVHRQPPGPERWMVRSRTLDGIAAAMAEQWGGACHE